MRWSLLKVMHIKKYKKFNPNTISNKGWVEFGFSQKQVNSILKYKAYLGGNFNSKQQIKDCYVISDKKYQEISDFILLPETHVSREKSNKNLINVQSKQNVQIRYQKFNPNNLEIKDWIELGFTEKQASSIIRYKYILGGEFSTKDQLKKCYVINDKKYQEIEEFIKIPQKAIQLSEINSMKSEDFIKLGFESQIALRIINYRNSLGGFVNINQLKEVYGINKDLVDQNIKTLIIENKVQKIDLNKTDNTIIFKHPYLRKIAPKIVKLKKEKGKIEEIDIINYSNEINLDYALIKLYLQY